MVGTTASPDFPLVQPIQATFNGSVSYSKDADSVRDAFVARLNPAGSALEFATYIGGSGADRGLGVGLDRAGNIYVGGTTTSPNLPTVRPLQAHYSDSGSGLAPDSFVTKLDPSGTRVRYTTYFGADGFDDLTSFAVDTAGNVYLAGSVDNPTPNFPLVGPSFQTTNNGIRSAYVAKIADDGP